jgi:hypothetical protein
MTRTWVSLGLKTFTVWLILMLYGLTTTMRPVQGVLIAFAAAVAGWLADLVISFKVQGATRWAIDSGIFALVIYLGAMVLPGVRYAFSTAIFLGFVAGSVEIPIHFYLASRFGLRRKGDEHEGIS